MKTLIFCMTFFLCAGSITAQTLSGNEVLQKIDANMVVDHALSTSTMIVHGRSGSRTITSQSWVKGRDHAFVEYLSPARERGKKMLKVGDQIWNYTPEPTDRIITISGHLLRQSVMGSDLSYEDMTDNDRLVEQYNAEVIGEDEIDGQHCYVLQLSAKGQQNISYFSRKLWVDSDHWLPLREERYAKGGKLLKTMEIVEIFQVAERWYPKKIIFKDALSSGKGTEYLIDSIDFDVEVPDPLFTRAALRR